MYPLIQNPAEYSIQIWATNPYHSLITKAQLTKTWWLMKQKHACVNLPLIRINSILKTQLESPWIVVGCPHRFISKSMSAGQGTA